MIVRDIVKSAMLITVIMTFNIANGATSHHSLLIDSKALSQSTSPLPEGARIVAGDLSKNEFFIVAANRSSNHDEATIEQDEIKQLAEQHPVSNKKSDEKEVQEIKVALKKVTHNVEPIVAHQLAFNTVKKIDDKQKYVAEMMPTKIVKLVQIKKAMKKAIPVANLANKKITITTLATAKHQLLHQKKMMTSTHVANKKMAAPKKVLVAKMALAQHKKTMTTLKITKAKVATKKITPAKAKLITFKVVASKIQQAKKLSPVHVTSKKVLHHVANKKTIIKAKTALKTKKLKANSIHVALSR